MMTEEEQVTLWLGAFRYYIGRMTYAVGDFCNILIREWPGLSHRAKTLIRGELEREFVKDDMARIRRDGLLPLGHDCDRAEWERVRRLWSEKNAEF